MEYDPDTVCELEVRIRTEGKKPLRCPECGNHTRWPNGEQICSLCQLDRTLTKRLGLRPRKGLSDDLQGE